MTHIPHFFLHNKRLSATGDLVLDPFCGSGTVLLEALLAGRKAVGCDTNPLACLIARAKTCPVDVASVRDAASTIVKNASKRRPVEVPSVVNLHYWFHPHVIRDLARLSTEIRCNSKGAIKDFLLVALSVIVRRVSLADPRLSVPVRLRSDTYPKEHPLRPVMQARLASLKRISVPLEFLRAVEENLERMEAFHTLRPPDNTARVLECPAQQMVSDAKGTRLARGSVRLIVTSPPYPGAQKYIRASSLSLGWLGLCSPNGLRDLEARNIGREHYRKVEYATAELTGIAGADHIITRIRKQNPLRAHIVSHYLVEMRSAFVRLAELLQEGGHLVLICGDGRVCGQPFPTSTFLTHLAIEAGMTVRLWLRDEIHSRGLMTKRHATASVIPEEHVVVLEKD